MASRFYNLPSLTALSAFEAASRHLSFKLASHELNVTPGAVSHQIKTLEDEIGVQLFERVHRGVVLTEQGQLLASVLGQSFGDIAGTVQRLRNARQSGVVTIAATSAVSALWLTPRLANFWTKFPEAQVNQYVSDTLDTTALAADLIIKYGILPDKNRVETPLFNDQLAPMCAPNRFGDLTGGLEELAQLPLIHLNAHDAQWTRWRTWFADLGYTGPIARARQVNTYTIALQAAQAGAGIVLGWRKLVQPLIASGQLVPYTSYVTQAPVSFNIASDPPSGLRPEVARLRRFLLQSND